MKNVAIACVLSLAITLAFPASAQTLEESVSAFERQDYSAAFNGFKRLAELGNPEAQNYFGWMYDVGMGVAEDRLEAIKWYRKAADLGSARAQVNLGAAYGHGGIIPRDERQAVKWFLKAAEQGNAEAQFSLGYIYSDGNGVPKDNEQAYFWWFLSSAQEFKGAAANRDRIGMELTAEQREKMQMLVLSWKPK